MALGLGSLAVLESRLETLLDARACLPPDSRRLLHGRGRTYTGWEPVAIDWFAPALVITLYEDYERAAAEDLAHWLHRRISNCEAIFIQYRHASADARFEQVLGEPLQVLFAQRNSLRFRLRLDTQNIGYFLDMEPARQWLENRCEGLNVLNLFAYTCAFSVVARAAGAKSVLNMDLSSNSLSVGRENHRCNALPTDNIQFLANDIRKSWGRLKRYGPYDLIVVDPPSFQKGSFVASRDYEKLLRRLPELCRSGTQLLLCLNSPETRFSDFKSMLDDAFSVARFQRRLEPSADFPEQDDQKSLKLLIYSCT